MTRRSTLVGGERVTALVGTPAMNGTATMASIRAKAAATSALSGAMTSDVLKTALSVIGRGRINWAGIATNDTTVRTLRMRITLDGSVIRDFTSPVVIGASDAGFVCIGTGHGDGSSYSVNFQPLRFYASLLIEIASSLTETDKATFAYNYEVFA